MSGSSPLLGPINCHVQQNGLPPINPAGDPDVVDSVVNLPSEINPDVDPVVALPPAVDPDVDPDIALPPAVDPDVDPDIAIDIALTCLKLSIALRVAVMGTSFAGYARWA